MHDVADACYGRDGAGSDGDGDGNGAAEGGGKRMAQLVRWRGFEWCSGRGDELAATGRSMKV